MTKSDKVVRNFQSQDEDLAYAAHTDSFDMTSLCLLS